MRGMHRRHRGAHVLVAGTGPSLERVIEETPHDLVIGVNAAPGRVACFYNVVQDHPDRFQDEKREAALKARVLLSAAAVHAHWRLYDDLAVKWEWTRDFSMSGGWRMEPLQPRIPTFDGTPFAACWIAAFLGASRITLAGVDYTDGHAWADPSKVQKRDDGWAWLSRWVGVPVRNGNPDSRLGGVQKVSPGRVGPTGAPGHSSAGATPSAG